MPTTKKSINISISKELDSALRTIAKRDRVPEATKAAQMLQIALELEEDKILSEIAERRDTKGAKYISHKQALKMFLRKQMLVLVVFILMHLEQNIPD